MITKELLIEKVLDNDTRMHEISNSLTLSLAEKVSEKSKCVGKLKLLSELMNEL